MDTTLRLCFVEGVARPGWRGVLFVGWSVGCLPLVRKRVRKIEHSTQCILRNRGQWHSGFPMIGVFHGSCETQPQQAEES